jgi:hypothetical protein
MEPNQVGFPGSLDLQIYAPADFQDSEITRPPETYLDTGSQTPATIHSSVISNVLHRHTRELRDRHVNAVTYTQNWKRKVRDFFLKGNESVLSFLTKPVSSHPTLGQVEQLIRRYSKIEPEAFNASNKILKDLVTDLSGIDTTSLIEEKIGESIHTFVGRVHAVYELYRELQEQTMQNDVLLKAKINTLDKIQPRMMTLMELSVNEESAELEAQIEKYLQRVYSENNPEEAYKNTLILYKKFLAVKELLGMLRLSSSPDKEPICGICLDETVLYALVPCGHTLCDNCVRRQVGHCFICRQPVRERIKIYFT